MGLDDPHVNALCDEQAGDREPGASGAVDDDVLDSLLRRGDDPAPGLGRLRRADDDDAITELKTSVWRAAGTPIRRDTASAVSRSEETTSSTSSSRSCQRSRYSSFVVRTIAFVAGESFFAKIAAMMLISSRDVHAMKRSASLTPASASVRRLAPLPTIVSAS
jgi:hypothetical protein